jgi:hypothetical protein
MIRSFVLLLQIMAAQPTRQAAMFPADSVRLRTSVDSATRAFQQQWADAWMASQSSRRLLATHE